MSVTLYGIKNCDTVRKARKWLEAHHIDLDFHDFRADGLEQSKIDRWLDQVGMDTLLNKRSTTWKQLSEAEKAAPDTALLAQYPTLIKRPVLAVGHSIHVGFSESTYQTLFKEHTL